MKWKERWGPAISGTIFFLMFLIGFLSEDAVNMVIGLAMTFAMASTFLASYIRSDHIVKRTLEVVIAFLPFSIIAYGYIVTRSLILGAITLFIVVMFFIAFTLSYLLPRIHRKPT